MLLSELEKKSIFIISGTREQHANYIKQKLQELFIKKFPFLRLESKYTELWLKKTWIKVFPTKNVKDIRGYFEASYIWVDESDYLDLSIQQELMNAIAPGGDYFRCGPGVDTIGTFNQLDGDHEFGDCEIK
jgi:hypothetical protein